jgi:methylated-DNA-[protein]-cysteine S-methyltransferase
MPSVEVPRHCFIKSPWGYLLLTGTNEVLTGLYLPKHALAPVGSVETKPTIAPFATATTQLQEYFEGKRQAFDLKMEMKGTPFQKTVWKALTDIPYGTTISYGELARRIGNENASRAVGLANGKNPISIIVPCHRVIGASGKLTGYGGGLELKQALLEHEQTHLIKS